MTWCETAFYLSKEFWGVVGFDHFSYFVYCKSYHSDVLNKTSSLEFWIVSNSVPSETKLFVFSSNDFSKIHNLTLYVNGTTTV